MIQAEITELTTAHKLSIWVVVGGFVGACTHIYLALAAIPFHLYCAFRIGRAIQLPSIALAAISILMLIPIANTLGLLLLNNKAARLFKQAGVPIGPMGFKRQDVNSSEELLKAIEAKKGAANQHVQTNDSNG